MPLFALQDPTPLGQIYSQWRKRIFWTIYLSYASYYFGRANLSIALPKIIAEFGWDKTTVGIIASAYFATYAIGKFVNGILGDVLGGRTMIVAGILLSAVVNFVFGFGNALMFFAIAWGLNGFFQAMGWAALVSVIASWFHLHERGKIMGWMSTNYQLGNVVSWLFASAIIAIFPWRFLFWIPAVLLLAIGVVAWLRIHQSPESVGLPAFASYKAGDIGNWQGEVIRSRPPTFRLESEFRGFRFVARHLFRQPGFWIICFASLTLTYVRWTFVNWLPTYLTEQGVHLSTAALSVAIFPLLGSAGTVFAGWVSDAYFQSRRGPVLATMCFALTGAIVLLVLSKAVGYTAQIVMMGVTGFTLFGPYSLLGGVAAQDFGTRHAAATASGIIDTFGYIVAIAAGVVTGFAADNYGWAAVFLFMAGMAFITGIVSLFIWNIIPAQTED